MNPLNYITSINLCHTHHSIRLRANTIVDHAVINIIRKFHRRPVTQRVRDIGVWYRILDSIGKLSVITNGFIIAFTSEFIPRLVYQIRKSTDGSLNGYVDYSLSRFNTSDFDPFRAPKNVSIKHAECRYPDYRYGHGETHAYEKTYEFWIIIAARLLFVLIFEVNTIIIRFGWN